MRMADSMTVLAPAKINIGLRVFPKRADGYHDIAGIFTTVALFDSIKVSVVPDGKKECLVECRGLALPPENTFTAAYKAFCVLTGVECSVRVFVDKHIPSGGGLGGGSSDAASFIQSIDKLFATHLEAESFYKIAASVGSDVFFFMHALVEAGEGKPYTAVVGGRGEKVRQIASRTDFDILLLSPGVSVSTKDAYSWVDDLHVSLGGKAAERADIDWEEEYKKPVTDWSFDSRTGDALDNDFTLPVCSRYGAVSEAIADMCACGARYANMSGSGSTVFGIFPHGGVCSAKQAAEKLSAKWKVWAV